MDEKTLQTMKEQFDSLPREIQDLIMSEEYQNSLIEIGKKHKLNIEQLGVIEKEVTLLLLGLTLSKDFENDLARGIGVDRETGRNISQDVSDQVLSKIRHVMQAKSTVEESSVAEPAEHGVLRSAGIEITPQKPKVEFQTPAVTNDREEVLKKVENPDLLKPERELPGPNTIHEQKLSGSFVLPKKETHYEEKPAAPKTTPDADPYREPIN